MVAAAKTKVLRSVFLDPQMDEILRQVAFRRNTSKGDLIRTYVERGLEADREALLPQRETAAKAVPSSRGRSKTQGGTTRKTAVPA
ncbi:hypothetical protein [Siccirubricoccus phaeus]|uniref:hypothetical protein n=1 Tax=Siccirubricoccus phaeus TaxID=2595053 RepID=UPI0011F2798E|nr:hypothetical protein [Siccirubricoccus phaeus]